MNYPIVEYYGFTFDELKKLTNETKKELLNELENDIIYSRSAIENMTKLKNELIKDEYYYDKSTEIRGMRKLYYNDVEHLREKHKTLSFYCIASPCMRHKRRI